MLPCPVVHGQRHGPPIPSLLGVPVAPSKRTLLETAAEHGDVDIGDLVPQPKLICTRSWK